MAFPLCKLMAFTGPLVFPDKIALGVVRNGDRFEAARVQLIPNDEIEMTLFEFGDQDFIPFPNPLQLRLGINAVGNGQDLGETILDAGDAGQGEKTARFHPAGIGGPFYELTYKVLP